MKVIFSHGTQLSKISEPRKGITTSNNDRYLRFWHEVCGEQMEVCAHQLKVISDSQKKWFPINKGGDFRKWYGNKEIVIDWKDDGEAVKDFENSVIRNSSYYFREGMTWNDISSSKLAMRYSCGDCMFEGKGPMAFVSTSSLLKTLIALFNSKVSELILSFLCPTLNFNIGEISKFPILHNALREELLSIKSDKAIDISKKDWDNFEISWDFQTYPLLRYNILSIAQAFDKWQQQAEAAFRELKCLEEENNRYWIDAYGLQDELTPEVPDEQITIRRADLQRDIKSLISYAVGCMMGRYSLDKPGLILASQGQTVEDYWKIVNSRQLTVDSSEFTADSEEPSVDSSQPDTPLTPDHWQLATNPPLTTDHWQLKTKSGFQPDTDAIIPITDQAYFDDDIVTRFVEFIKVAFSPDTLTENLDFIANALAIKAGETARDRLRRYFVNEFISDHIKTYKKRPIYWLFTSGKKRAFGALVYLHRYTPETVGRIRTDYILELQVKLDKESDHVQAQADSATTTAAKRAATKRLKTLQDQQLELRDYQARVQTFGDKRIALDLDDGVAYNYTRFKGIIYEGTDLKMKDLEKKAQWKLDLLKTQEVSQ